MSAFPESYAEARRHFRDAAAAAGARLRSLCAEGLTGRAGETLAIDIAELGPMQGGPVVVVLSGVHGVEGFAGSVVQRRWLERLRGQPAGAAMVFVHGVNAWGFSWLTRCDENNVDLNRNLVADFAAVPANAGYAAIHPILAAPAWAAPAIAARDAALAAFAERHGAEALTDALIGGQYAIPEGLNYGGSALARPVLALCRLVEALAARHDGLVLLDLHTGIAPRGDVAVLPFSRCCASPAAQAMLGAGDARFAIGASGLAQMTGVLAAGLAERVLPKPAIAAVVEFGTVARPAIRQALLSDLALRLAPPADRSLAEKARRAVLEAFWPSSAAWRANLLRLADVLVDPWTDEAAIAKALRPSSG